MGGELLALKKPVEGFQVAGLVDQGLWRKLTIQLRYCITRLFVRRLVHPQARAHLVEAAMREVRRGLFSKPLGFEREPNHSYTVTAIGFVSTTTCTNTDYWRYACAYRVKSI